MNDTNTPPPPSSNAAGGCSLGCASIFVITGVLWPLLHLLGGSLDENILMFFPLLIGLPCFVVAHILAVIGLSSKSGKAKRLGKWAIFVMWGSLAVFFLILFAVPEPSIKSVAGKYEGSFYGISEVLELKEDGKFVQELTLPSMEKLTTSGTWELKHRAVELDRYLMFFDAEKNGPLIPPREVHGMTYGYSSGQLIRDWNSGFYAPKRR